MNGFNKTEAAVFSCGLCFLRAFLFISLSLIRHFQQTENSSFIIIRDNVLLIYLPIHFVYLKQNYPMNYSTRASLHCIKFYRAAISTLASAQKKHCLGKIAFPFFVKVREM